MHVVLFRQMWSSCLATESLLITSTTGIGELNTISLETSTQVMFLGKEVELKGITPGNRYASRII
jgi:hypothetical protein